MSATLGPGREPAQKLDAAIDSLAKQRRIISPDRALISDIDNTLIGDADALKSLVRLLNKHRGTTAFGVASGRRLESALGALEEWSVPMPDVLITAVGTEIYHGPKLIEDKGWRQHLKHRWRPRELRQLMDALPGIELQPDTQQRELKLSYDIVDHAAAPKLSQIADLLSREGLHAKLVFSHRRYLDLLPMRASKGLAVRHVAEQWRIPISKVLVAGDSGNDEDMLRASALSVVVGNHEAELKALPQCERIYFANGHYARGILEGLEHYDFFGRCAARA